MSNTSLAEIIRELVDGDRVRLPVNPMLAKRVIAVLATDGPESKLLWTLVNGDPALICNLFRAANSSFFAGLPKTVSVDEAVTRLGHSKAAEVVEQACREEESSSQGPLQSRYLPRLWQHAQGCAIGSSWLADRCGYHNLSVQAYLAGLLHDVGKQFLLAALEEIASNDELGIKLTESLIEEVISSLHVQQGIRLVEDWNLADVYKDVVADHHDDDFEALDIMVALVKLANKGCHKAGLSLEGSPDLVLPTTGEAQFLGIDEIPLAEFEIMLEDRFSLDVRHLSRKVHELPNGSL